MEEKVKVSVLIDKQYIREVMVALGITAADPAGANKILDAMGNEVVLDESLIDDKEKAAEMKITFAAIAIGAAAKKLDDKQKGDN